MIQFFESQAKLPFPIGLINKTLYIPYYLYIINYYTTSL